MRRAPHGSPARRSGRACGSRIHRPILEPSPILLPPNTTGIWLEGGSALGFNRIWAGGHAEVEYSNGNIPTVRGDLQWGGRPAVAEYASLADIVDLRRGEGLSTTVVGNPVSSWASQGAASDVYSNATGGTQPLLTADGTLYCDPTSAISYLANTSRTSLSGEVICMALAYKIHSYTSGEPVIAQFREDSNNRLRLSVTSSTNHRLTVSNSVGNSTTFSTTFGAGQTWRAVVHVLDKINAKLYTLSNSRSAAGTDRMLLSAVTTGHFPAWESWTMAGGDNAVGAPFTAACVFEIAGYAAFEEADAIVGSTVDWDFMLRMLGQMRSLFPLGEDG